MKIIATKDQPGVISYSWEGEKPKWGKTVLAHMHEASELFRKYGFPPELFPVV